MPCLFVAVRSERGKATSATAEASCGASHHRPPGLAAAAFPPRRLLPRASTPQQSITMTKAYTAAEVFSHNSADSTWLVIEGKVYDVTKYLDSHPGGFDTIVEHAGA